METDRVFRLEQRPQEFLPTSLNSIQFQHLRLICRPHDAVCRRCKMDIASGMPQLPDVKSRMPDLLIQGRHGLRLAAGLLSLGPTALSISTRFPVPNLRQVPAMLRDVLLVLDEFFANGLLGVGGLGTQ